MKKNAFTLAEIMIVLSVIAVLSAILLPAARNAMPNKKILKFKKGHNALYQAINELVNSDEYYQDGDLGTKADGTILTHTIPENRKYLCETLADVMTTKHVDCQDIDFGLMDTLFNGQDCHNGTWQYFTCVGFSVDEGQLQKAKKGVDNSCRWSFLSSGVNPKQIVTTDDVWFYDSGPGSTFGLLMVCPDGSRCRYFSPPTQIPPTLHDNNGIDVAYKYFCMDIDGIPEGATAANCINECPFGYLIRADGRIISGERADKWLNKSIQEKD